MRADRFTNKVAFVTGAGQAWASSLPGFGGGRRQGRHFRHQRPALEERRHAEEKGADFLSLVCDVSQYDQVEAPLKKPSPSTQG
jgi:hypothetical protein